MGRARENPPKRMYVRHGDNGGVPCGKRGLDAPYLRSSSASDRCRMEKASRGDGSRAPNAERRTPTRLGSEGGWGVGLGGMAGGMAGGVGGGGGGGEGKG